MSARDALDRRLVMAVAGVACALLPGCGTRPSTPRKIEMEPIGTVQNVPRTVEDDDTPGNVTTPNSGTPNPQKEAACTLGDVESLEEALKACEVAIPKASELPSLKDKLEVKLAASSPSTTPGGRVDLTLSLKNKTSEPLPLYFTGDPSPHFDVETIDAKGRRADLPTAKWPGYPKGFKRETREVKGWRITLDKGGTARVRVAWDAVKSKWAPDKAKTWEGRGHPRVPSGPLPAGRYTLRVLVPVIGEIDTPTVAVAVGS